MNLDEIDKKIIDLLYKDARISFRKIAKKLGISIATVSSRISKMEKMGIIKGYSVCIDQEKIGYELTAIIEIVVSKGKLIEVEKEVARMKNVVAVYDITGTTDSIVIAKFRKRSDMSRFIKSLLAMKYVERTNTHFVLNTVKEDFRITP